MYIYIYMFNAMQNLFWISPASLDLTHGAS